MLTKHCKTRPKIGSATNLSTMDPVQALTGNLGLASYFCKSRFVSALSRYRQFRKGTTLVFEDFPKRNLTVIEQDRFWKKSKPLEDPISQTRIFLEENWQNRE